MEVKIDYEYEIIQSEKQKIKWILEEFRYQFPNFEEISEFDVKLGNEILNFIMDRIDITKAEVLDYLQKGLEKVERTYPILFK